MKEFINVFLLIFLIGGNLYLIDGYFDLKILKNKGSYNKEDNFFGGILAVIIAVILFYLINYGPIRIH